jgi:radical SAM superfamily enzyme YgiQ (UPF0313 family)
LRVERAQQGIRWMADRGVLVRGLFMLGFPTETREEIEATVSYAVNSGLTQAYFFNVVPQPGTPLYDLALEENAAALESQTLLEYNAKTPWYMAAYGVDMPKLIKRAYVRFFVLSPRRWVRLIRLMPWKNFVMEFRDFARLFLGRTRKDFEPLPDALLPLSHLYAADDVAVTSAQTHSSPFRRKATYSFESRVSPPKATTGSPEGLSTA